MEIIVRMVSREPDKNNWKGNDKRYYEYDSTLGWRKIPNINEIRINAGGGNQVLYITNSKGMRGPEYSYEKAKDEYRILILGDSFAEGYLVEFYDLFSEVLKRKLNSRTENKNVQVINTGTIGWSTDQELLFYQTEGKKYKPDLTVLMFYENDIFYNNQPKDWSMYYKPLFKIENGSLILTNVPVPKPDIFIYYDHLESKNESISRRARNWLNNKSYLYNLIKDRIKKSHTLRNMAVKIHLYEEKNNNASSVPLDLRAWEKTYNKELRNSWEITEAMLVKLKEEAASVHSGLLVFYIPNEASIYRDKWEHTKRAYGISDDEWNAEQPGIELGNVCRKNNVDFINPTDLFKTRADQLKKSDMLLYHPKDGHWNIEGNRFVGEILSDYIYPSYLSKYKKADMNAQP